MKINFKSTQTSNIQDSKQLNNENIIEYNARLEKTFEDNYNVFTFEEIRLGKKITNRIEYNQHTLKIFSGKASLECQLDKIIKNHWVVPGMENNSFYIYTKMYFININDNLLNFYYKTSATEDFKEYTDIKLELKITN